MLQCEGCGSPGHIKVRLTNGGLNLCHQCLHDFNRKNPAQDERIAEAVLAERQRCANIAWKMQMEQFGGGTAIGNKIQELPV